MSEEPSEGALARAERELQLRELRETQVALQAARALGVTPFDASPVCSMLLDPDGVVRKANSAALALLGLRSFELVDRPFSLYVPTAQHAAFLAHRHAVLREGTPQVCAMTLRRGDGEILEVEVHSADLSEGTTGARTLLAVIVDLTPRRRAERSLALSEAKYRDLFDDSRDALVLFDIATWRVLEVNHAACGLFGAAKIALQGAPMRTFFPAAHADPALARLKQMLASDGPAVMEVDVAGEAGADVPVEMCARAAGPQIGEASFRDIRARRRAETARARAEAETRQAVKMESIGLLAGGIAHEMNNLLGAIMSVASVLETELSAEDRHRRDIVSILTATRRGRGLIGELLRFARKGDRRDEVFALTDPLRSAANILERARPPGVFVVFDHPPAVAAAVGAVRGDPGEILQVIINLAINAFDAMPDGGVLTLSVVAIPDDPLHVCVLVSDTGIGMDEAVQARAFEPYFTTKPRGHGTGLGLATVLTIMRGHGGEVQLVSAPGAGTTAQLTFPLCLDPVDRPEQAPPPAPVAADRGAVLIVDDDDGVRDATSRVFDAIGFRVTAVASGAAALACWPTDHFQFVLLDFAMPHLDGGEVIRRLEVLDPQVRILLCSGYSSDRLLASVHAGARVRLLPKPWSVSELEVAIAELLAQP